MYVESRRLLASWREGCGRVITPSRTKRVFVQIVWNDVLFGK